MGYDKVRSQEIWEQYASEFPVREQLIYLNHAAVAPLPRRSAEAMRRFAADACEYGSLHYDQWLDCVEKLRVATARLIGAHRDEIALVKNTSEGIATVALGIDWRPGDHIVAFEEEFPANLYIWKKLESRGVKVTWLSFLDPLDKIDAAARGARLLAISYVQYLSGFRADLAAIGRICRAHNVFFFVDAIQGLGAFPLDVDEMGIDALAADGHKWLLGPEGWGVLYVRRSRLDEIEPVEFGWTNVAAYADYASRDMSLRRDAGRYECGTLNMIGSFGLLASMELLLQVGIPEVGAQVRRLTDQIVEGAQRKGYEILGTRTPAHSAGIVCIRKDGIDSRAIHAHLRDRGVLTAPRQGWVRISPHFYVSPEEIDRMVGLLP